jgi:GTP cyclohydrolase II
MLERWRSALTETTRKRPSAARVRTSVTVPLQVSDGSYASTQMVTFHGLVDGREHIAVIFKDALSQRSPLVRVHSECLTGDVFRSIRCDCGAQCQEAITLMHSHGGVLLYLRQEGRGIGLYNKIEAYSLQDGGMDTFEANRALNFKDDQRDYTVAAQMLKALGVHQVEILSNNPEKARQLREAGITVSRQRSTQVHLTEANRNYLHAKRKYADHVINFDRGSV